MTIPSEPEASTPQGADAPDITGTGSASAGAEVVGEQPRGMAASPADAPEEVAGPSDPNAAAGGSPAPIDCTGRSAAGPVSLRRFTSEQVRLMRALHRKGWSMRRIAQVVDAPHKTVRFAISGESYKDVKP